MELKHITNFQFKRENPFEGLVIDADLWRDAHVYHRDHQRLHVLAFHQIGIVGGLEVTANDPADQTVIIHPGMGIDPEGNVIIVPQSQKHKLQSRDKGVVYLIIQFREVPGGPFQPPEGGQPTRILEAYRIEADYAYSIEAYTGSLGRNGDSHTVDFLRLGRSGLYWLSLDRTRAGLWDPRTDRWLDLDASYAGPIEHSIRVARKQAPPELLRLPVWTAGPMP